MRAAAGRNRLLALAGSAALAVSPAAAGVLPVPDVLFGTPSACANPNPRTLGDLGDDWALLRGDTLIIGGTVGCEALQYLPSKMGPAVVQMVCETIGAYSPLTILMGPHDSDPDGIGVYFPETDTSLNLSQCN